MKSFLLNISKSIIAVTIISFSLYGQDVHFSHMEYSPLTLNPALAGANSPMQGIVNYRSQWNSVATPYQTIAASFDARFNENKRNKTGIIAGGINFFNDQAGELKVTTNTVNINLAYHLILDRTSTLGLGVYTGFGQRSVDPNSARWGSQYDGMAFNGSIESGETFKSASFSFVDAGAGLLYAYKKNSGYSALNDQRAFNMGFSAFHVNRPGFSFIDQNTENLYIRWSVFANANISINNTKGAILPGVYFQRQKTSMEILYGAYYKYLVNEGSKVTGFNKPMSIYIGIFNRFKDAMVGKFMLEWDQYSAGFGYDFNISSLNDVSKTKGGFELFLRFNMGEGGGFKSRI